MCFVVHGQWVYMCGSHIFLFFLFFLYYFLVEVHPTLKASAATKK